MGTVVSLIAVNLFVVLIAFPLTEWAIFGAIKCYSYRATFGKSTDVRLFLLALFAVFSYSIFWLRFLYGYWRKGKAHALILAQEMLLPKV